MKKKHQPAPFDRPKQVCPAELVDDLLSVIRNQFCCDLNVVEWRKSIPFFTRVLTHGAKYLNSKGVTLPPDRYKAIYQDIFTGIKQHGATAVVKSWHGYLLKCVQEHFDHHGEDYYNEGKSIRAAAERALLALHRAKDAAETRKSAELTDVLAQTHAVLSARRKRQVKRPATVQKQGEFSL